MAKIKHAHATQGYLDDDYQYHDPTVMGKCSDCHCRIEVEMDETNCPECGAEFDMIPKEMLAAMPLRLSV